jgi:hypothetical protein
VSEIGWRKVQRFGEKHTALFVGGVEDDVWRDVADFRVREECSHEEVDLKKARPDISASCVTFVV